MGRIENERFPPSPSIRDNRWTTTTHHRKKKKETSYRSPTALKKKDSDDDLSLCRNRGGYYSYYPFLFLLLKWWSNFPVWWGPNRRLTTKGDYPWQTRVSVPRQRSNRPPTPRVFLSLMSQSTISEKKRTIFFFEMWLYKLHKLAVHFNAKIHSLSHPCKASLIKKGRKHHRWDDRAEKTNSINRSTSFAILRLVHIELRFKMRAFRRVSFSFREPVVFYYFKGNSKWTSLAHATMTASCGILFFFLVFSFLLFCLWSFDSPLKSSKSLEGPEKSTHTRNKKKTETLDNRHLNTQGHWLLVT